MCGSSVTVLGQATKEQQKTEVPSSKSFHLALRKKMTVQTEFLITDLATRYTVCLAQGVQS